jgi:predicted acyltransferase
MAIGLAWNITFPINKNLWTSSFVMFTGGAAAVALAMSYWLIDVKGWRWWTKPFVILGVNALALYVLSAIVPRVLSQIRLTLEDGRVVNLPRWISATFSPLTSPQAASLVFALLNLVVLYVVLWGMYRRKIFLRA